MKKPWENDPQIMDVPPVKILQGILFFSIKIANFVVSASSRRRDTFNLMFEVAWSFWVG